MKLERNNEGFVLTGVLMLLLIATLVGGAFLFSARSSFATVDQWRTRDDCLAAIQTKLEEQEYFLYKSITNASINCLDKLANWPETSWSETFTNDWSTVKTVVIVRGTTSSGSVAKSTDSNTAVLTMTNTAWATLGNVTRKIREIVTLIYTPPQSELGGDRSVFDNAFFIDNIGVFSGVNCDFNGDVYSNKDMDLKFSSMKVNGDSYSGGVNLSKNLYKSDTWSSYGTQSYANAPYFSDRVRPAEYTDYNKANTNTYWPQGYKGVCAFYDNQQIKEMPFIGPVSEYEAFALANTGSVYGVNKVTSAGVLSNLNTTVDAIWGDEAGENAGIGTNDNGCLILIGTYANPIVISNIVVARGDIYIKGYYKGQGTLYAGRNIYVMDELVAMDPPSWPHPDPTPKVTAANNQKKDFMGLCAKGCLALGNPAALDKSFLTSPYTGSHATDISDIELGYISFYTGGVPYFDGDYTKRDGQYKDQLRSDNTPREFNTPMIGATAFSGLAPVEMVGWADAVLYANHLIAGTFGANAVFNGAMICRDESIVRKGNLSFNWDIRLGSRSYEGAGFRPGLAGTLMSQSKISQIVKWTELVP